MATENGWLNHSGKTTYAASGHWNVLLIVSECESQPGPDVVQRRAASELTEEWRGKLENQGIPREHQHDDLSIIKARYGLDSDFTIAGVEMSSPGGERLTREMVLKKIETTMKNSNRDDRGVDLYYIGAGRRGTGDWCFDDGFITFRDLADLYLQLLRGRVLCIVADCSHSGSWVRECRTFLDEQGVGPCGHSAKDKGILISVSSSCLSHQVPQQLAYSVQFCKNDKNTGLFAIYGRSPYYITNDQYCTSLNTTEVRCGQSNISSECLCLPQATWQNWSMRNRIKKVCSKNQNIWIVLLLIDDDETMLHFLTADSVDCEDYGQILKVGHGEEPTQEDYEAITQNYPLYRDKPN